jgi:hypothetical protein
MTDNDDRVTRDEPRMRGEDIERLLDAVQGAAGPAAWPRVEALVAAIVELYGSGLERILATARASAHDPAALDARLVADELVANLLLLHGLHPLALHERIGLALEHARSVVPSLADLELVGIEDGVVNLRVSNGATIGSASVPTHIVGTAIERAAPEVSGLRIEGLTTPDRSPKDLIPVARLRRGGRP